MDLEVVGRHALLFDDDAASAFVNSGDALVDWNSLKIDRYDVRNLLTDPPPPRRRGRGGVSDDLEEEIDRERYLDLPSHSDEQDMEDIENQTETVGYHSVGFSYGNADATSNIKNNDIAEASGFTPPFPVPEYILQRLPPSEKLHQIIARTATFVSKHGGQSEIVLRVKQGDNPTFGFLMPGHDLHPYFRYLVDHPELLHSEHEANLQEDAIKSSDDNGGSKGVGGSLSLLGSVYASGEDDEGDNNAKTKPYVSVDSGNPGNVTILLGSKKIDFVERKVDKDDSEAKTSIISNKENNLKVRENASVKASKSGRGNIVDERLSLSPAAGDKLINSTADVEPLITEPPSEMKMLIDKLVEFVVRNGDLFEANLIEQDSKHGRFPFLVPSNLYHPYYLKARQAAQESKLNGKSSNSVKNESVVGGKDKKAHEKESFADMPPESDRREKFKMVIGKSKEAQGTEPRETQRESGVTVDAASAAAILQAAIRGIKPSNLHIFPTGSSARDGSEKSGQSGSTEAPPKSIARAASVEADSAEAQLAQEKSRKAERLKRAKMFVAMLKGGAVPFKSGASRSSSMEPLESGVSKSENNCNNVDGEEQREGSLAPADDNNSAMGKKPEMNYFGEENNVRLNNRKYRTRSEAYGEDSKVDDDDDDANDVNDGAEWSRRRKHRSKSRRHGEVREDENALESEKHQHNSKRRHGESKGDVNEEDSVHRQRYDHSQSDGDGHDKDKHHKGSRKKHSSHHSSHHHSRKRRSPKNDSLRDESDEEERDEQNHRKKHRSSRDKHDSPREDDSDEQHRRKKHRSSRDKHDSPREDESDLEERNGQRRRKRHRSSRDRHVSEKRPSRDGKSDHKLSHSLDDEKSRDKLVKDIRRAHNDRVNHGAEGEISSRASEESKGAIANDRITHEASVTSQQNPSASQPSEPNADIPEDLRAKIRAMLMANRS